MTKSNDFKYMLLLSILFHLILVLILSYVSIRGLSGKTIYLTEVTWLGEMPFGKGVGMKGDVPQAAGKKSVKPQAKKAAVKPKVNDVKVVKPAKIEPKSEEEILKIRKESPIGVDELEPKNSGTVIEGPVAGGGFGDDTEKPGSLDGNALIEGPIRSRGILYNPAPDYPDWAKKQGVEGVVQVQIKVNSKGEVSDIFVVKTCGYKELDQIVIDSMRKWKFEALPLYAKQDDQEGKVSFKFNLKR